MANAHSTLADEDAALSTQAFHCRVAVELSPKMALRSGLARSRLNSSQTTHRSSNAGFQDLPTYCARRAHKEQSSTQASHRYGGHRRAL